MSDSNITDLSRFLKPKPVPLLSVRECIAQLRREGCGAFVGRTACGDPVTGIMEGQGPLRFQSAQGAWVSVPAPRTPYLVATCTRHGGPDGPKEARLMQDMPAELQAQQIAACAAWLASFGERLDLRPQPKPDNGIRDLQDLELLASDAEAGELDDDA